VNKKFLPIVLVVGAVVVLAIGAFAFFGMNKGSLPGVVKESVTSGGNSLRGLLTSGSNQQCSFKDEDSEGTVYVAAERMRGNFTTTVDGKTTVAHMIIDNNTMYNWVDGENTGFTFAFDPEDADVEEGEADTPTQSDESVDLDKEVDYNCSPWSVDNSFFTPPADVDFQDFSSMMPQGAEVPQGTDFTPPEY